MLHCVAPDQSTCTTQASLAVNCEHAGVALADLEELLNDRIGRSRAVDKEHISVRDPCFREFCSIVLGLVETNNMCHPKMSKHLQVVFRRVPTTVWADLIDRAHKRDVLARDNPIQVTILDFLIILILLVVELSEVVPAEANGDFESLETVEDGAAVGAVAVACVPKRPEACLVRRESFPGDLRGLTQDDDHEGAHQIGSVGLLVEQI